uniref:Zinc finger MYM-type protein 5-like n=1 Tax=Diabrotica virgifera virgifera TaxID=50390 RepID=A0A6P7GZ21_DIAVI
MEQKRKKLSGSQYKKIRMQKEEQGRKLSNVMKEFLVQKSCLDEPSTSPTATATNLSNKNLVPFSGDKEKQEIMSSVVPQQPGSSSSGCHQIVQEIPSDPALWNIFSMYSETRQILVERGPYQIKEFDFPINKGKRRFSSLHYSKMLSNGEVVERSWLIYSVTNDAVFCFCCFLFDNLSTISDWPKKGYSDWGNLTRAVTMHEKSVNHRNAFRAWQELDIRLKQKKTIDAEYQRIMDKEILHWREISNGYVQDPELLSLISFNVNTRRTRNTEIFNIPFHTTNYGQNEPITRILRTANEHSNSLELFGISIATLRRNQLRDFKHYLIT